MENRADITMAAKKKETQAARNEFARRLQKAMIEKGWNQVELATRAQKLLPEGRIERDTISTYIRALAIPLPAKLHALCQALGLTSEELLPARSIPIGMRPSDTLDAPFKEMKDVGDGNAWLRINQSVPYEDALQILSILKPKD